MCFVFVQAKCDEQGDALESIFAALCGSDAEGPASVAGGPTSVPEGPASVAEYRAMIVAKIESKDRDAKKEFEKLSLRLELLESDLQVSKVQQDRDEVRFRFW